MWVEKKEPGTHCLYMCQVPLVTCIPLRYTKITINSVYLLKVHTAWLYSLLASFPGSCVWAEKKEPGTHCSHMCQVPLVTCILLHCTKITINSVYLLKVHTAWLYSLLASFPGSCVWAEKKEPGTHCSHMCQVPLVTCILLRYTKITINSVKVHTAWLYSLRHRQAVFKSKIISFRR